MEQMTLEQLLEQIAAEKKEVEMKELKIKEMEEKAAKEKEKEKDMKDKNGVPKWLHDEEKEFAACKDSFEVLSLIQEKTGKPVFFADRYNRESWKYDGGYYERTSANIFDPRENTKFNANRSYVNEFLADRHMIDVKETYCTYLGRVIEGCQCPIL